MDIEPERPLELYFRDQDAVGGQDHRVGIEHEGGVELLGLEHGNTEALGHELGRRRPDLAPAPGQAVGASEQEGDLAPGSQSFENICAEGRCRGDGEAISHGASPRVGENHPRPQHGESLAARLESGAVEEQNSVEVIELVLNGARGKAVELQHQLLTVDSLCLETNRDRALDWHQHALQREAAFLFDLQLVAKRSDARIDDRLRQLLLAQLDREHPLQAADLVRGQTDSVGIVYKRDHPLGLPRQRLVEDLNLARAHTQNRIRVLADLRQRRPPHGRALDVELDVLQLTAICHRKGFYAARVFWPRTTARCSILAESRSYDEPWSRWVWRRDVARARALARVRIDTESAR